MATSRSAKVSKRRDNRRASIQWFAIGLGVALTVFGVFLYLIQQDRGVDPNQPGHGGGVHLGLAPVATEVV